MSYAHDEVSIICCDRRAECVDKILPWALKASDNASLGLRATDPSTWRLQCISFLVVTRFLIRDYNILLRKELHRSLQVVRGSMEPSGCWGG